MKKSVFLAFFFLCIVSYGGSAVAARAAGQQTLSPAETAALNRTLENMKMTLLQMQDQLAAKQNSNGQASANGSPAQTATAATAVISAQDAASLRNVLTALGVVLSSLQSNAVINDSVMTMNQKTVMRSVLNGIGANLSSMNNMLAGNPARGVSAITQASGVSAPIVARVPSRSASGNAVSVPQVSDNANPGLAQIATTARWSKWSWPIGIAIVVILLAWAWFRREKKAQPVALKNNRSPKKDAVIAQSSAGSGTGSGAKQNTVPQNFPKEQHPSPKIESKPAMSPLSSVVMGTPAQSQPVMPQKFQEQKKATG